jgi:hypothetical protein
MTFTDQDMRTQVTATLDGTDGEHDVNAIVDEIQAKFGTVDVGSVDVEVYWDIVAQHAK